MSLVRLFLIVGAFGVLCLRASAAPAFEIEHSETRYVERRFECELRIRVDASLERVEAVLRDYENYPALDPRILQARILERPRADLAVLETMLRACFGPFCRNVIRVERVEESLHGLTAIADPARSDVEFGETHTQLSATEHGGTLVHYRTSIAPDFWIPAIVGRRWMLRTLESATSDLFMNVELRAQQAPPE